MEKEQKPADQNAPHAGEEVAQNPPVTPESLPVTKDSNDVEEALNLAEDYRKELESAQKKIRHLEKRSESGVEGDPGLREEISALKEEIVALREQQANRMQSDGENIAKLRTREAELRAALIARQSASNSSLGTNQDKQRQEEKLPELNTQQEKLYTRIAQRHGMTLEEWRKKNQK